MSFKNIARRLAGAAKNGVVWGGAWFTLAFATLLGLRTIGVVVPPEIGVLDAVGMAIRVGIFGGFAGGAFALFISRFYRGRRLSEINPLRFGLGGAVVAEVLVLAFFGIGLVTGGGFPALKDILSDLIVVAAFGGISAGASMWLAQRAESRSIGAPGERDGLHAGSAPGARDILDRARVPVRPRDRADS
jgi:hypothetical protein